MKRLRTLLPSAALLAAFAALLLLPQQTSAAVTDGLRLSDRKSVGRERV